ncbi:hypothetical protein AB0K40_17960 [Nonomuraea bangladeshensis]|uniref:DUF222 domain-containing protein n=1 Tax=Nonomuraea bangladeshensis TaxID=404385 RepID=A0ABV3H4F5_9ACTN
MTALMGSDDLMRQAGATWCDQHKRWECTKKSKRSQQRCHAFAVRGTATCYTHAGVSTSVAKAKGEALSAWRAVPGRQDVSPSEAVLAMLQMSWARVGLYASLLEQQVADAQGGGGHGLGDDPELGPGAGLIGHTRSGVKDIGIFATGEALRGLTLLEEKERDRCVRFAKTAHDMGIADREIRLAEQQGALIAGAISRILDALELTAAQRALVPTVVPGVLLEIAGEAGRS